MQQRKMPQKQPTNQTSNQGVKITLGPSLQEKQDIIDELTNENQTLSGSLSDTTAKLSDMEAKCVKYADELIEAKSMILNLRQQLADTQSKAQTMEERSEFAESELKVMQESLQNKSQAASTLLLDHDSMKYRLNELEKDNTDLKVENKRLADIIQQRDIECEHKNEQLRTFQKEKDLLLKAKNHKDNHCAILVQQKEKLIKQLDRATGTSQKSTDNAVFAANTYKSSHNKFGGAFIKKGTGVRQVEENSSKLENTKQDEEKLPKGSGLILGSSNRLLAQLNKLTDFNEQSDSNQTDK